MTNEIHALQLTKDDLLKELTGFRLFSIDTIAGFLREVGFACAIAWAISISIERVARERDERHVEQVRTLIAQDVFRAVIGSFVPKDIRDITFDTILLSPITRSRMRLDITITQLPEAHKELRDKFIHIEYVTDYEVNNDSSSAITHNVDLYIDKCFCEQLRGEHKIETVTIGEEGALNNESIKKAATIIDHTDGEMRHRWIRTIPARGRLRVYMRWSSIKGIYDSVVWTTLLPTIQFEVRLDVGLTDLTWTVDPLHHGELKPIEARRDRGLNQFQATKPLLPYQGIQVSWRPAEAAGASIVPAKESAAADSN
jgi:hypothetical protein